MTGAGVRRQGQREGDGGNVGPRPGAPRVAREAVTEATAARLRLFVAVSVPRPQLEALDAAVAGFRDDLHGARWAPLDNQHVTLKFLGSTPAELFADVAQAVQSSAESHSPSDVALGALGAFPSDRRARVLWAGIDDPGSLLTSLAATLDREMEPLATASKSARSLPI